MRNRSPSKYKRFFKTDLLLANKLKNLYPDGFIDKDLKTRLYVALDKGWQPNGVNVNNHTYLNADSSLSHFGGDVNAFLLLKSLWNSVGDIFDLLFYSNTLVVWLTPETHSIPCKRLHLWPSHMTSISHTSCLTPSSAVSCSDWLIFLAVHHVISSAALLVIVFVFLFLSSFTS